MDCHLCRKTRIKILHFLSVFQRLKGIAGNILTADVWLGQMRITWLWIFPLYKKIMVIILWFELYYLFFFLPFNLFIFRPAEKSKKIFFKRIKMKSCCVRFQRISTCLFKGNNFLFWKRLKILNFKVSIYKKEVNFHFCISDNLKNFLLRIEGRRNMSV